MTKTSSSTDKPPCKCEEEAWDVTLKGCEKHNWIRHEGIKHSQGNVWYTKSINFNEGANRNG